MSKVSQFSTKGGKSMMVEFPRTLEEKENPALLAQAIRVYEDRGHPGLAKVKTRGEVAISTRKIYRQKGTGGARHGARSAPIFVGGGVAHGPKGIKRTLKLSKKMAKKALKVAFGVKIKLGEVVLAEGLSSIKSTKEAYKLLNSIKEKGDALKGLKKFTLALSAAGKEVISFFRNIEGVTCLAFKNLNAKDVLLGGTLIIDSLAVEKISSRTKKSKKSQERSPKRSKKL